MAEESTPQPEPERVREEMRETVRELTDELESIESLEHASTGSEPPLFKSRPAADENSFHAQMDPLPGWARSSLPLKLTSCYRDRRR